MELHKRLFAISAIAIFFPLLPSTVQADVSVGAGNDAGESASVGASEPPSLVPESLSANDSLYCLPIPTLTQVRRVNEAIVEVNYECKAPKFGLINKPQWNDLVSLVILRQFEDGEWERVWFQLAAGGVSGTFEDNDAPIARPVRYAAITEVITPTIVHDAASDALPPKSVNYLPAKVGLYAHHSSGVFPEPYSLAPPGFRQVGAKSDRFEMVLYSPDGVNPSFVQTDPPYGGELKSDWEYKQDRSFNVPSQNTELSAGGYVIRGQEFTVWLEAQISDASYEKCRFRLEPLIDTPLYAQGEAKPNQRRKWLGRVGFLRVPESDFYSDSEGTGFENVTYFAAQHLGYGLGNQTVRTTYDGTLMGGGPTFVKVGPFELTQDGMNIDLVANPDVGQGTVTESVTGSQMKVFTLPPRVWTVGLYRVDVLDIMTSQVWQGVEPPDADQLETRLNTIFGLQANIHFDVVAKPPIFITSYGWQPVNIPVSMFPFPVSTMKEALWNASEENTNIAIFYMHSMEEGTGGQCFAIPSRGAVIGPMNDPLRAAAHEIGHCLGLHHSWYPDAIAHTGGDEIPDKEENRLMGYKQGVYLRHREIDRISDMDLTLIEPLTGQPIE